MENKNTIVALSLMMLLWIGYTFLFPAPQVLAPQTVTSPESAASVSSPETTTSSLPLTISGATKVTTAQLKDIKIETDLYRAVITTQGARLKEFYLKKYKSKADESALEVNLVTSAAQGGTFALTGEGDFSVADNAIYAVDNPDTLLQLTGSETKSLSFSFPLPSGVTLLKTYTFNGQNYSVAVYLQVQNATSSAKQGTVSLSLIEDTNQTLTGDIVDDTSGAATLVGSNLKRIPSLTSLRKISLTRKKYSGVAIKISIL